MKRILLLSTGGTIASRPGADGLEPEMSGQELLSCLGDLSGRFQVEVRQIMSLDSSNVQAEEWKIMARSVYENLEDFDGFIITHGTDTMAYSASMLSFMLNNLHKPVVFTGSQIPMDNMLTDARNNLFCALAADVFLLKLIPNTNPRLFDHLAEIGYRGVVLETFGAGGMHFHRRDLLEKLRMLEQKGIVVVACSQCLYEPSNFTIYEVGRKLLETGVIPAGDMTTEAAVTKLMWALGQTEEPEKVKEIFSRNYTGEISE